MDVRVVAVATYCESPQWDCEEVREGAASFMEAIGRNSEARIRDETYRATRDDRDRWLSELSRHQGGPLVVYWAGHAEELPAYRAALGDCGEDLNYLETLTADHLFHFITDRQSTADAAEGNWLLLILDTCKSGAGAWDLWGRFHAEKPRNTALLATSDRLGSADAGVFPALFAKALDEYGDNEKEISIDELLNRVAASLGERTGSANEEHLHNNIRRHSKWPRRPNLGPLVGNRADVQKMRDLLSPANPSALNHFYSRVCGGGINQPEWFFTGREDARRNIFEWLQNKQRHGLYAVTGLAGSGKSALLGMILLSSSPELAEGLRNLGVKFPARTIPDRSVEFTTSIHLSNRTLGDVIREIGEQEQLVDVSSMDELVLAIRQRTVPTLILADALDECHDPFDVAVAFRRLADLQGCRVLVGTRRSLSERPDSPIPADHSLFDTLKPDESYSVEKSQAAYETYIQKRLVECFPQLPTRNNEYVSRRISADANTFLFVRLAVDELVADPTLTAPGANLSELLATDHRGLFDRAVHRIRETDPTTEHLLHALAYGRGSGLPRTGGIWQECGSALAGTTLSDPHVSRALDAAAPYIVQDSEFGREVYRLSHYAFVEWYQTKDGFHSS